jgi:hypothetical protein
MSLAPDPGGFLLPLSRNDKKLLAGDATLLPKHRQGRYLDPTSLGETGRLSKGRPVPKEQPPRKLSGKRTSKVPSELWREAFSQRSPKG